ncbi:MAG: hypothetical protein ACOH1F_05160 [Brevundimonas sp.]
MKRLILHAAIFLAFGSPVAARTDANVAALDAPARTVMRLQDCGVVEVDLDFDPSISVVEVSYRLINMDSRAIAVFDRADLNMVVQGRQGLGDVAVPHQTFTNPGDLEFIHKSHEAIPDLETPTVDMAVVVAPGDVLKGKFRDGRWGFENRPILRLRWCLGTMVFDELTFYSPVQSDQGQIWHARISAPETQHISCTAWYDVARRDFEP